MLEANLQHFLEREGIAFVNERHKVAVGALMASRRAIEIWRLVSAGIGCSFVP